MSYTMIAARAEMVLAMARAIGRVRILWMAAVLWCCVGGNSVFAKDVVLMTSSQELRPFATVATRYPKGATWALRIPDDYAPGLYDVMAGTTPVSGAGDQLALNFHWPSMEPEARHKQRIELLPSDKTNVARALPAWPYVTDRNGEFFFKVVLRGRLADHKAMAAVSASKLQRRKICDFAGFETGSFALIAEFGGDCDLARPLSLAFVRSDGPTPIFRVSANEINRPPRPAGALSLASGVLKGRAMELLLPIRELGLIDGVMAAVIRFLEQHTTSVDELEPLT